MRSRLTFVLPVVFALAGARAVSAQTSVPFQLGVGFDSLAVGGTDGGGVRTLGSVRITAPLAGRFALEGFFSIPDRDYESYWGAYGVQVRQRLVGASRARTDVFVTYGGMGGYDFVPAHNFSYATSGGRAVSYRVPSDLEVIPPVIALVGAGVEQRIMRRLTVRLDAQLFIAPFFPGVAGVRISSGVAIPLGRAPMPND